MAKHRIPSVKLTVPQVRRFVEATRSFESEGRNRGGDDEGSPAAYEDFWIEVTGITVSSGISYLAWKHKKRVSNAAGIWQDHPDGIVSSSTAPDTRAVCHDTTATFTTGSILRAIVDLGADSVATYSVAPPSADAIVDAIIRNNTAGHYGIDLGHWEGSSNISTGGHFISDSGTAGAFAAFCPILALPVGATCQVMNRFTDTGSYYTVVQQAKESFLIPYATHSIFSSALSLPPAMYAANRVNSPRTTGISTTATLLGTGTLTGGSAGSANYFINLCELGIVGSHVIDTSVQNSAMATQWGFADDGIPIFVGSINPIIGRAIGIVSSINQADGFAGSQNVASNGTYTLLTSFTNPSLIIPNPSLSAVPYSIESLVNGSATFGTSGVSTGTYRISADLYNVNASTHIDQFMASIVLPGPGNAGPLMYWGTLTVGAGSTLTLGVRVQVTSSGILTPSAFHVEGFAIRATKLIV